MYYLQSRYYDPAIGRFINADSYASTGQGFVGFNMFAYCLNNPVNYVDSTGSFVATATAVSVAVAFIGKILFDFCVSALVAAAVWEIGSTIVKGVKSVLPDVQAALVAAKSKQQERIKAAIIEGVENSKNKEYRSDTELHHIVARNAANAEPARSILYEVGIGINSTFNTVELNTSLHRRLHTNLYYGMVNRIIIASYRSARGNVTQQKRNVINALNGIRAFLLGLDAVTRAIK